MVSIIVLYLSIAEEEVVVGVIKVGLVGDKTGESQSISENTNKFILLSFNLWLTKSVYEKCVLNEIEIGKWSLPRRSSRTFHEERVAIFSDAMDRSKQEVC